MRLTRAPFAVLTAAVATLAHPTPAPCQALSTAPSQRLARATNEFGLRLLRESVKRDPASNVVLSPASVEFALAMAVNGALGKTRAEIAHALGVESWGLSEFNVANLTLLSMLQREEPKVQVSVANSLWGRQGTVFDNDFVYRCVHAYGAEVRPVDFGTSDGANAINSWVRDRTRNKIDSIVSSEGLQSSLLVIVNALYFKGQWTTCFDPAATRPRPFALLDGKTVDASMMYRAGTFLYSEDERAQMVCLPYGSQRMGAYVVLPRKNVPFASFIAGLDLEALSKRIAKLTQCEGSVTMPRVRSDTTVSLKAALSALGVTSAFTGDSQFGAMLASGEQGLYIGDVLQRTTLDVDEEGTTAAAVTAVRVDGLGGDLRSFSLVADRPFVLIVRDTPSGAILFVAAIVRPKL